MKVIEDECVGCPPDLGCIGNSCKYMNVKKTYCDICGCIAEYRADEIDLCGDCFAEYLQDIFDELSIEDKADLLNVEYEEVTE